MHANHGGVSRGSQSWMMVIPELKMSVAVMINANTEAFWEFGSVSYDLVEAFLAHAKAVSAKHVSAISAIDRGQQQEGQTTLPGLARGLALNLDDLEPAARN